MPKRPKGPWYRKGRGYYCFINGEPKNLFTKKSDVAWKRFYDEMAKAGVAVPPEEREPISVLELVERFCDWAGKHRAQETSAQYDQFCKGFLKEFPEAGTTAASDLRPYHVQGWIDRHSNWSTTTQNRAASAVKRAYSWGAEQGLIEADPIRPLRKAKPRRGRLIVKPEEWSKLLAACPNGSIRTLLELQRLTGVRPQELRGAEIRHYDRTGKCLRFLDEESKGDIARVVILADEADLLVRRSIGARTEGPILTNTAGEAWRRHALHSAITRLIEATGVRFNARTLRHTYATEALDNGVDDLAVGYLMGHVDPSMVGRIYSHMEQKPDYLRRAAETAVKARTVAKRKAAPKGAKKRVVSRKARVAKKKARRRSAPE